MKRPAPGRRIAVDLDPQHPQVREDPGGLARAVDRTLTTSVRLASAAEPVSRLRHLNLQQLAALEVSGGPMQLRNDLCTPGAVFIVLLVAGDCTIRCQAGELRLSAGQFTLLRGDRTLDALHAAPFVLRGTRLPAAQLERELARWADAELLPIETKVGPGRLVLKLQDALLGAGDELTSRSTDTYAALLASVLADALRSVLPPAGPSAGLSQAEHHRRRIRAYVREHLADPALDVAAVARGVGLSVSHVHRLFAAQGQSLAAWVLAERLDACRQALGETSARQRSVTHVALSWGFSDTTHFSRSFKRRFGMPPSAARRPETAPP